MNKNGKSKNCNSMTDNLCCNKVKIKRKVQKLSKFKLKAKYLECYFMLNQNVIYLMSCILYKSEQYPGKLDQKFKYVFIFDNNNV